MKGVSTKSAHLKLKGTDWIALILLGFSGQIAWVVENGWFNPFVYENITPDPRVISWMVGASAVIATLTTFLMGTLSDKVRKRKPFILVGYILWGISTALFPTVAFIKESTIIIAMVVMADCLMTFFGSTANDAALNAWITDITDTTNRGRVEGVLGALPALAIMVTFSVSGIVIEKYGYYVFFYALGVIVILNGLIGGLLLKDSLSIAKIKTDNSTGFFKRLISTFSVKTIKENKALFITFIALAVLQISVQVYQPYQIIYFTDYLHLTKTEMGIVVAIITLITISLIIPFGRMIDRQDRIKMALIALIVYFAGLLTFSFVRTTPLLLITGIAMTFGQTGLLAVISAWIRDLTPIDSRGQFQGMRMIFFVLVPMIIGPAIGSSLIMSYGIPTIVNGAAGFIPSPIVFQAGAVICLLTLLPLIATHKLQTKVTIDSQNYGS